jgi:hypothetical protein
MAQGFLYYIVENVTTVQTVLGIFEQLLQNAVIIQKIEYN